MSIRRKLFLAFVAAAALPLLAMGVLARLHLQEAREQVERDFVRHSREAARALRDRAGDRTDILRSALKRLGRDAFTPQESKPFPDLWVFPQGWLDTPEGKADQARLAKKAGIAVTIQHQDVKVKAVAEGYAEDEKAIEEAVQRFRAAHPQVLGVRVILDDETLFDDLPHQGEIVLDPPMAAGEERDYVYNDGEGHHYMVWARHGGATRIAIEIDARAMIEPMSVAGVKAFYLYANGQPHHTPDANRELAKELPLSWLAGDLPPAGESRRVKAWRIFALASAERDPWDYGGQARLVAVAPEALIDAPLRHFQVEVAAAGLVSLLFAVGLSYFLSGRFSESVENLKRGVDALSRGELMHLEKSSGDELGGGLVESMNRMASALAERTRKEEIESWRRLVRVLSHEINNTLGPVKSVAATVRDQLAPQLEGETGDDLKSAFKLIVDRVDSLSSFISGYAVLAKLPPPKRELGDLNEVVRGAVSMLKSEIPVEESYDQVGNAALDKEQIERVAINLVKNAVEAAASRVWVATERRGDTVELRVEDDGPGIAAEARAHLFVPYYTTKPGGSGIGLALARQIVLGHGGTIAARDRDGGGTILSVILPAGLV